MIKFNLIPLNLTSFFSILSKTNLTTRPCDMMTSQSSGETTPSWIDRRRDEIMKGEGGMRLVIDTRREE